MPSTRVATIACLLLIPFAVPAAERPAPAASAATEATVVARVGDEAITLARLQAEMDSRARGFSRRGPAEPYRTLLGDLVHFEALVAKAYAEGYDKDPELRRMFEKLLVARYKQDHVASRLAEVSIDPAEVRRYYDEHPDEFATPERLQGALVFIEVRKSATEQQRADARTRIEEALAATGDLHAEQRHFGEVASSYSHDRATRFRGGVIGWLERDRPADRYKWETEVVEALFALERPGDVSPIVETDEGYYLVRLVDREAASTRPFEKVRSGLESRLQRAREREVSERVMAELMDGLDVTIDEALVTELDAEVQAMRSGKKLPPALPAR